MKRMYNTFEEFEQLPQEVKNKIIRDLAAYDETHVFFEHGKYDVSVDWCLRASYGSDHRFIGEWSYKDLSERLPELKKAREDYLNECSNYNWDALND